MMRVVVTQNYDSLTDHALMFQIQLLERSIEMRNETITADKREIEERKTALKTADMIDSSLNHMQKIGLIKQICKCGDKSILLGVWLISVGR